MASAFDKKVLGPTNEAIHGDELVGWSSTAYAESIVGLGGRPNFMCAPLFDFCCSGCMLESHCQP